MLSHIDHQIAAFRLAAELADRHGPPEGVDPRVHQAMIDAMNSEIDVLNRTGDPGPFVTESGRILTDEDFEALADEAERGYDIPKENDA